VIILNSKRGLKTRTPISNSVDTELLTKFKELSNETMIPISKLLDKGMSLVLKEYNKEVSDAEK
jgi:hypothetical protein